MNSMTMAENGGRSQVFLHGKLAEQGSGELSSVIFNEAEDLQHSRGISHDQNRHELQDPFLQIPQTVV